MLLPDNIRPENSIYYNGAMILMELKDKKKYNLLDLYQTVKEKHEMNFAVFVLCLDWLYLISAAILNQNGEVELCF